MAINPYRNTRKYDKFKRKSCIYFVSEKFSTLLLINLNISRANISINVKLTSVTRIATTDGRQTYKWTFLN